MAPLANAVSGEVGLLFSFHYMGSRDLGEYLDTLGVPVASFVDSGGFSAWSQGVSIDLDRYASWLRRYARVIDHYANLDVIGSSRGTLLNQIRLERLGLRPLPIVHYGSSQEEIRRYHSRGYEYQCLGGMVPRLGSMSAALRRGQEHDGLRWLKDSHEAAAELGVKLHGFGVTSWGLVQAFPWRSVDSSSWASGIRYGRLVVFDHRRGRWQGVSLRDRSSIMPVASLIREYGGDPIELIRDLEHSRRWNTICAVRSWVAANRWLASKGDDVRIYIVTPGIATESDTQLRNAVRVAAGVEHDNGIAKMETR